MPGYAEKGGSRDGFLNVGVNSLTVLGHNGNRSGAIITNDSDTPIYISLGTTAAVVGSGIRLNAAGGVLNIEPDAYGRLWKGAIQAISAGANKNLAWEESW